jgi:hypothetical protein
MNPTNIFYRIHKTTEYKKKVNCTVLIILPINCIGGFMIAKLAFSAADY